MHRPVEMWLHTRRKPDFVFRRNGRFHLNGRGRQFSQLAAEVCLSTVVMLDKPYSEVVWRVLATHSIRQFPLHFPPGASPCAITFNWSLPYHNCIYDHLPEDEPSGSKHVEDIEQLKFKLLI